MRNVNIGELKYITEFLEKTVTCEKLLRKIAFYLIDGKIRFVKYIKKEERKRKHRVLRAVITFAHS